MARGRGAAAVHNSPQRAITVNVDTAAIQRELKRLGDQLQANVPASPAPAAPAPTHAPLIRCLTRILDREIGEPPQELALNHPRILKEPVFWVAIGLRNSTIHASLRGDCMIEGPLLTAFKENLKREYQADESATKETTDLFEKLVAGTLLLRQQVTADDGGTQNVAQLLVPDIKRATELLNDLEAKRLAAIGPQIENAWRKLTSADPQRFAERDRATAKALQGLIGRHGSSTSNSTGGGTSSAGKRPPVCRWCHETTGGRSMRDHQSTCEFAKRREKKKK